MNGCSADQLYSEQLMTHRTKIVFKDDLTTRNHGYQRTSLFVFDVIVSYRLPPQQTEVALLHRIRSNAPEWGIKSASDPLEAA